MIKLRPFSWVFPIWCAGMLWSCSGGGSGGTVPLEEQPFLLQRALHGRLVEEGGVQRVVSPYSTVETDPVSAAVVPGTLEPLSAEVQLDALVGFGLGPNYLPRVVPRDGTLVLEFNAPIDPDSVVADVFAPDGSVWQPGSVRIRDQLGRGIPVELIVEGSQLWVHPVVEGQVGFPASPVVLGPDGDARADATGTLRLIVPSGGEPRLRALDGRALSPREDRLGASPANPIGFNPGNEVLDFLAQDELVFTNETFNGFLPDLSPPRIIREHQREWVLDQAAGDVVSASSILDADAELDTRARNGAGEWADTRLVLRPGEPDEERHRVQSNTRDTILLVGSFQQQPADGDVLRLERAEFFEPDLDAPIDPRLFDPNNPQNLANSRLSSFVRAFEIDAAGEPIGEALDLRDTLPAYSELRVRFNEPMDVDSFREWESFRVALNPDPGPQAELVSHIRFNSTMDEARIQPARLDADGALAEVVGWGRGVKALQFQITSVPTVSFLQGRIDSRALESFLDEGRRGLRDLGGRPLAFSLGRFDPAEPVQRYTEPFFTDEALSSQDLPPESRDWGMLVHRFQGRPTTGADSGGRSGVFFADREGLYSPAADVNLLANGRLSGPAVAFITKVHDEFYPPPDGSFGAFTVGAATPLVHFVTAADGNAPIPHQGVRFQQVYRDVDASPGRQLAGTLLDLYRVSWSPIGGNVSPDTYEDISLHLGHSPARPITQQNGAAASYPNTGLNQFFDYMSYEDHYHRDITPCAITQLLEMPNHLPGPGNYVTCVPPGTQYKLGNENLFTPPFDTHNYHPWPAFVLPFQYNNGDIPDSEREQRAWFNEFMTNKNGSKPWIERRRSAIGNDGGDSLLIEVRVRPQDTPLSARNGFTFAPGVLIDRFPFFRIYSRGEVGNPLWPDNIATDPRARCATTNTVQPTGWGDNSRYFAVFDYVKTTARVQSTHERVFPGNLEAATYFAPRIEPPVAEAPPGTQLQLEYEGASNVRGGDATGFADHPSVADGLTNIAFRVTFVGNSTTLLAPSLETVAIPYLRE